MALNPSLRYPVQVQTGDAGWPWGKARNSITYQDGSGTPLEKDWVSDLFGFEQALLSAASLTPSGTPDHVGASQYMTALDAVIDAKVKAMLRPDRALSGTEDFIGGTLDVPNATLHANYVWSTIGTGATTVSLSGGNAKNPGALVIEVGSVADTSFVLTLQSATFDLANIGSATMVVRVDADATESAAVCFFGFFGSASNQIRLVKHRALGTTWRVYRVRAGVSAYQDTGVPWVSGEFITARFLSVPTGVDVEINGVVVTTVLTANLPIGTGTFGARLNGSGDVGDLPSTIYVDLLSWQSAIANRSGA